MSPQSCSPSFTGELGKSQRTGAQLMSHPSPRRLKGGSGEPQACEPDLDPKAGCGTDHTEHGQPGPGPASTCS